MLFVSIRWAEPSLSLFFQPERDPTLSTGPELPFEVYGSAMAPSPDGNGVILFGGTNVSGELDSILELKADGQGWVRSWTILSTKLQYPRFWHMVTPVLMDRDVCDLSGIIPDQ